MPSDHDLLVQTNQGNSHPSTKEVDPLRVISSLAMSLSSVLSLAGRSKDDPIAMREVFLPNPEHGHWTRMPCHFAKKTS